MGRVPIPRHQIRNSVIMIALLTGMLAISGCGPTIGWALSKLPPPIPAKYASLKGQSVAVMVWADRGIRVDFPHIQLDTANGIQAKLINASKDFKDELKDTRFPVRAASAARLQEEHPEWAADNIEEIAPRLKVSRLIYVEIGGFQTRPDSAVDLFRGTVTATVRVVEVTNGKARVVYTEENVRTVYPEKSAEEGVPGIGDFETYRQTVNEFTSSVANLFHARPAPDE